MKTWTWRSLNVRKIKSPFVLSRFKSTSESIKSPYCCRAKAEDEEAVVEEEDDNDDEEDVFVLSNDVDFVVDDWLLVVLLLLLIPFVRVESGSGQ